ncbi:cytochrome c oxidase subunit 5B, mitochondrial-like [Rhopilema esculentum]|uniref:cytochrome c oxidase subunit 5B, mitochondrial-like n=1 Tax=Rhopilema esculentum TaxID=499914 RepID=UPI0031E29DEC|eukprot:gene7800-13658_t
MALRLLSSARCLLRSTTFTQCARISTSQLLQATERAAPAVDTIPTEEEQATGLERREFEAMVAGNMDPFNLNVKKGPPGTRELPTVVPSSFDQRIVGCICEEDATSINWMILKKGPAQRCECGNFFQLTAGTSYDLPAEH